jgi:peroxiredoxin
MLEQRYARLSAPAKESLYGKMVGSTIDDARIGAIGTPALDFTQNDPDGKAVSLSSFKGKYVLVDFWASWCKPCRMENPNVVEAYRKFNEKNFTVLGVSLDRSREPWLQAIKDDRLEWTHVSDLKFWSNAVAQQYRISSIPQNLLIDPKGVIIAKNLRGAELQQRLASLLK